MWMKRNLLRSFDLLEFGYIDYIVNHRKKLMLPSAVVDDVKSKVSNLIKYPGQIH